MIFDFKIKYYINKIKKKKTNLCLIYNLNVLLLNMLSIFFKLTQVKRYTYNKAAYKKILMSNFRSILGSKNNSNTALNNFFRFA